MCTIIFIQPWVSFTLCQDSPEGTLTLEACLEMQEHQCSVLLVVQAPHIKSHWTRSEGRDRRWNRLMNCGGYIWLAGDNQNTLQTPEFSSWGHRNHLKIFFLLLKIILCFSFAREVFLWCSCCPKSWTLAISPLHSLGDTMVPTTEYFYYDPCHRIEKFHWVRMSSFL